ncbi:MAG: VWA domain-containing protein, partial [Myxococcota bacterium]
MRSHLFATLCLAVLTGACGGGLQLTLIDASVQKPSNVAVYFTVDTVAGEPVAGLEATSFRIYEDDRLVSIHESQQTILSPEVAAAHYTVLLVDMSGSVVESGDIPVIVDAATAFANRVGKYQEIAVFAFDGGRNLIPVVNFSNSPDRLQRGIARLADIRTRDPSTNLNGAVIEAMRKLDRQVARARVPLRFGTLVVFTDGSDRAARVPREALYDAVEQSEYDVLVIGVGAEIDDAELSAIGKSGVISNKDRAEIASSFEQAARRVEAFSRRYYLLGYCSPSRAGVHKVRIEAEFEGRTGELLYEF